MMETIFLKLINLSLSAHQFDFRFAVQNMEFELSASTGGYYRITLSSDEFVLYTASDAYPQVILREKSDVSPLHALHPQYFDIDTTNGLEVYVWKISKGLYRFGLMEGTDREKTMEELLTLRGIDALEMQLILKSYDIPNESISVIPYQHPVSSYISEALLNTNTEKYTAYIAKVRKLLALE